MSVTDQPDGSATRWVLKPGVHWLGRALMVPFLVVLFAVTAGAEGAALVFAFATLGAAMGLSGLHTLAIPGSTGTRIFAVVFLLVWLVLWTGGLIASADWLQTALCGRDVVELLPGELQVRHLWPRKPTRVATEDIRGVYLLALRGDLMIRTPGGSVPITSMGTDEERVALAAALRVLLNSPADATWRPALPTGYTTEPQPDGAIVISFAWQIERQIEPRTEWLVAPEMITIRERLSGSELRTVFTGSALELTTATGKDDDDDDILVCRLALLGNHAERPSDHRYTLFETSDSDPTEPRELGLWLAANARIPLADQITE